MRQNQPFRLVVFFLIMLCFIPSIFGQDQTKIDSLKQSLSTTTDDDQLFVINRKLALALLKGKVAEAEPVIDAMDSIQKESGEPEQKAEVLMLRAKFYLKQSRFLEALDPFVESERLFDSLGNQKLLRKVLYDYGTALRRTGDFVLAFDKVQKQLNLTLEHDPDNKLEIAKTNLLLGAIQGQADNLEASNQYLLKAYDLYEVLGKTKSLATICNNLAINYKKQEDYDRAIEYYQKSERLYLQTDFVDGLARARSNMASAYLKNGQIEQADEKINKSLQLIDSGVSNKILPYMYNTKGRVLRAQQKYAQSIAYHDLAEELNNESGNKPNLTATYRYKAEAYADAKNFQKAFEYRLAYDDLVEEIYNVERAKQLDQLEARYQNKLNRQQIELQEASITNLSKEVQISRLQKTLYGLASLLLLVLTIFGGWNYRKRIKDKEREFQQKQELQQQQLQFKHKELTSQMAHLSQKNGFIAEIAESLERVRTAPDTFGKEHRRIERLIKQQRSTDTDWEHFKQYFAEVHNDFEHKIREKASDITEKEIRLASFLRMNMTTKEIAAILNVLPETVLKSKYRLKKKLNLSQDQDLTNYITAI